MAFNCTDCTFTAQFESALTMHRQLHHNLAVDDPLQDSLQRIILEKANTMPLRLRDTSPTSSVCRKNRGIKWPERTTSATRLFNKIRARICRSKMALSTYDEEPGMNEIRSECTSKAMNMGSVNAFSEPAGEGAGPREIYSCHLCDFDADRITVLDRHLLNHHKLSLDSLLQLVLAKTKDGLSEDPPRAPFGAGSAARRPYYKLADGRIESGEYFIETVAPKIKILKHATTNTELTWQNIPDLKNNCQTITREIEKLMSLSKRPDRSELMEKMASLNECMCKFVGSSNVLQRALSRDGAGAGAGGGGKGRRGDETFSLKQDISPRVWERAYSEKMERNRCKHSSRNRSEQGTKLSSGSFYF